MKNTQVFEVNATAVWEAAKDSQFHPNQIRTMLLGMDGKRIEGGKIVRISEGAWNALATYRGNFEKVMSKSH